jgi:hypothetical protein
MSIAIACTSCKRRIRVPDELAGRRVTCPKCLGVVEVPIQLPEEIKPAAPEPPPTPTSTSPLPEPTSTSDQLGFLSLALSLLSVLVFCIPYDVNTILSGIGLLLGIWGLCLYLAKRWLGTASAAGTVRYPLAGIGASLFTLLMWLWPMIRMVLFE